MQMPVERYLQVNIAEILVAVFVSEYFSFPEKVIVPITTTIRVVQKRTCTHDSTWYLKTCYQVRTYYRSITDVVYAQNVQVA